MKNTVIFAGVIVASTLSSQADLVYSTDFVGDEYTQNTEGVVFDNGTTTAAEEWFGTNNGVGISGGDLSFANGSANRFRGAGVWLDTTGWAAGLVTVEVDVANFVLGADTSIVFQAYAATGVDVTNTVSLDLHGAPSNAPGLDSTGTATIAALGAEQYVTANGIDVPFTFTYNGTDDFVALTFGQVNVVGGTEFGSADLDNLTVNTVPEPSTYALLAGLTCLAFVMVRRRA